MEDYVLYDIPAWFMFYEIHRKIEKEADDRIQCNNALSDCLLESTSSHMYKEIIIWGVMGFNQ